MEVVDFGIQPRTMTEAGTVVKKRKRLNEEEDEEAEFKVNSSTTSTTSYIQLRSRRILVDNHQKGNRCSRTKSDHDDDISCCSSNIGSSEKRIVELPDLEDESVEVQSSTHFCSGESSMNYNRTETTPSSKLRDVKPSDANSHLRSTAEKMPTGAEVEEFFTTAEKNLQKQFTEKYNYDIVKDEPMEGRYEWIRIKP